MLSDEKIRDTIYRWTGIRIHASEIEERIGLELIRQQLTPRALSPFEPEGGIGQDPEGSVPR